MEVIIRKDGQTAALLTARIIAKALRMKPSLVLGLATGRTMESVYGFLAEAHEKEGLDFSLCRTFNLDEYVGLLPGNKHSYRAYMNTHLFKKVNIDLRNTHVPDGMAKDLDLECRGYEEAMRDCGGIDLQLLGIGRSGHVGFNEPLSAFYSRTRVTPLTPETVAQNAPLFGNPKLMPRRAITMGVGTIMESKRCIMLATGSEKAEVLAKAVEGPVTSMVSASVLQFHAQCTVIVDEDAAANLQEKDYYRNVFKTEPQWKEFH
ncbi:MAG: glucosamine-6-phosphate deaminase [Verrucomicrobia bacterium]|nr:glucosamine-6-phosphate deaminase [Verrucomicrobiota bacterium]MBU4246970.1 glucosamine-6-phosphate deaminase [Verrucomicrobiota bacterium]MBU4290506.1 glucosamine-6-phosphate deaminase [Verrucomicrobiota bacterium]MBU4427787.1 glucosamine-6-phosphate deaminase [Verrucomicrobiota bacterium]MCG2681287.1 glucosamine-6-phosphate deaminase [Kiritimatiellia bacterium]